MKQLKAGLQLYSIRQALSEDMDAALGQVKAMGYDYVGKLHKAGYKFGKWYDMITMEKIIADHPEYTQPDVMACHELIDDVFIKAGVQR